MKIKKLLRSLYFKIIGSIILILILFGFSSYGIIQKSVKNKIINVEHRITSIFSSALGKSFLDQLLFSDPSIFQSLLNSLIDEETITFAYIIDENSEIISHTFSPLIPQDIILEVTNSKESRIIKTDDYGSVYISVEPLFNGILGYMVLGQKLPDLTKLWRTIALLTLMFFILTAFIISLIITKGFTNPLYKLIEAISITDSDGIPTGTIPKYKTTEFNTLSDTINAMVTSVSQSRNQLRDTHRQLKNIFDYSLQIAIIGTDKDGLITLFNAGAERMLGYSANEAIGIMTPANIHLQSELEKKERELTVRFGRNVKGFEIFRLLTENIDFYEDEWTYIKKNGSKMTVNLIVSTVRDHLGNIEGLVGFAQDVTARKRNEAEITKYKEHLEMLVKERTEELQESLDRLKQTQSQLVESEKLASLGGLVAGVAHEINTPVGIGVTAASHLKTKTENFAKIYSSGALSRSDFENYINITLESSSIILSNMNRAANLINSFKQVAVDQSVEEIRTFKINDYIDEILLSTRSKFKHTKHSINISCPKELTITSYPGAIYQIFTNLLMNSLIHGFDGIDSGVITVDIKELQDEVYLTYSDNGVGIDDEHLKKIFEPFFTTKRGNGGTGLGMNILYNLVTQTLNGSVTCNSKINKGTTFDIQFPINLKKENI